MRERTKVDEWWERIPDGDDSISSIFFQREMAMFPGAKKHGKLYHVTRYRLAPLKVLRWVHSLSDDHLDATDGHVCRASVVQDGNEWCARVWSDGHATYAPTLAEAKAACAARLRELGYRVVEA